MKQNKSEIYKKILPHKLKDYHSISRPQDEHTLGRTIKFLGVFAKHFQGT